MSDLHFDPMADPKLVDRLSSAEPEERPGIFESSHNNTPARYGADSNWALLHSALRQTKQTLPNPAFVVLPGDFLAHNFRREFDTAAADHSDAAYRLFVREAIQFLALQLETELTAAERAQQRVWLVYHIPPEVDGFATLRRGSCPDTIVQCGSKLTPSLFTR